MVQQNLTFDQLPREVQNLSEKVQFLADLITAEKSNLKSENDLITKKEGQEILGNISDATFWRYEKYGKIKVYKIWGRVYLKRSELMESVEKGLTKK